MERKDFDCYNCGQKSACRKQTCNHKTKEDGTPTQSEFKRLGELKQARKQTEDCDNHLKTEEHKISWKDLMGVDEYAFDFHINGDMKDTAIVEDMRETGSRKTQVFPSCCGRNAIPEHEEQI